MYYLDSGRLRVEIADPADLILKTTRFDHTAYITEVTLDGEVRFCAAEPRNMKSPSSGGRGICSEFRCDMSAEAVKGSNFPKFGVGVLTKPDEKPYDKFRAYQYIPFEICIEQGEGWISFTTLPMPCIGYAAKVTRKVSVKENILVMEMTFSNTGMKPISFREYCHNFLSPAGMAVDSDYRLELPSVKHLEERIRFNGHGEKIFEARQGTVCVTAHPSSSASFQLSEDDFSEETPFIWKLSHKGAQVSVTGTDYYRPCEMVVWTNNHMLCPEVNFGQTLEAGEECSWKRQWKFEQISRRS